METSLYTSCANNYKNVMNNIPDIHLGHPPKRPDTLFLVPRGGSAHDLSSSPSPITSSPCLGVRTVRSLPSVEEEHIILPRRYTPRRRTIFPGFKEFESDGSEELNSPEPDVSEPPADWKDREADMDTAIKWIKQEIGVLKAQDRMLMRQLLELRATIHQLRGARSCHTSGSDLSSLGGSWASLEDGSLSAPCIDSPISERDLIHSFQARAVSMMSILPSPSPARHRRHIPKGNSFEIISLH